MLFAPPLVTRDLTHHRKLPARQSALHTVANAFVTLLASSDHPLAPSLRAPFLPAFLGVEVYRPRDGGQADEQLRRQFEHPPQIVLLQTVPSPDSIDRAWRATPAEMANRVFVSFPLHSELERARAEEEKEEVANLSMMVIATLAYELAQWLYVKANGYRPHDAMSDTASLYTTTTTHSVSSTRSSVHSLLAPPRHKDDVGTRAVLALLGCDYELLSYTIGSRELVKRRYPTRRSPALQPAGVYYLIHDTPAIRDCTGMAPTVSGMVPPHHEGDSMYAITSVLTPAGMARMHGHCSLVATAGSGADSSTSIGREVQKAGAGVVVVEDAHPGEGTHGGGDDDDGGVKGSDAIYLGL